MKKDDLTYKIIGCAMKVHSVLGCGFQEVIYQRSLAIELSEAHLDFQREQEQVVYYKNFEVGTRRADFLIENKVVVELKALTSLEDVHLAQAKNYLTAYNIPIGLLINFGSISLEYTLIFNKNFHSEYSVNSSNSGQF
jgi:GxxExxY protein